MQQISRNEAGENRELLALFDAQVVLFQESFAPLVAKICADLPTAHTWVCLDADVSSVVPQSITWESFLQRGAEHADHPDHPDRANRVDHANRVDRQAVDDLAMLVGTGGTTGRPKGVMLTGTNVETMSAITLMCHPFSGRPVYLALAPLTHAAGVLCFPVLCAGGEIVIMRTPDVGGFLDLVERHGVTHTFLPPTLIYMVLGHERLDSTNLASLQCYWYGAAPMSVARLEEALTRIGPVMAQLFGQTEAPMMISALPPAEHFDPDTGAVATGRLASAGRPTPLVTVAIMREDGSLADPGGFNVYSTEVEQAVMEHPDVRDCAVVGLPDDKWGERVVAVVQPQPGADVDPGALVAFVKERIGSLKAPKQVHVWDDLPRSKVGKVLKTDIAATLKGDG